MTNRPFPLILAVCAALAAPALSSASVHAQQPPPPPPQAQSAQSAPAPVDAASLEKQREIFAQANKLYDEGKYPQAEAAYLAAWKMKKSFDVAGNYGNLLADMNKPRAAAEFLSFAVREFPAGGKPSMRDALIKRLGEVQKLTAQLHVRVNKPGAEVFVDGTSVGVAPLPSELYIEPGTHSVEARLEGYTSAQATATVLRGKSGDTELTVLPPAGANKTVLIAGGAVAGVGVVAGAVLLGVGLSTSTSAKFTAAKAAGGCPVITSPQTGACATLKSALDQRQLLSNVGLWTLVGGGVVGVATGVYALVGGARARTSGLVVTPMVGRDGGGLAVGGTF